MRRLIAISVFCMLLVALGSAAVSAQEGGFALPNSYNKLPLSIELAPEFPGPFEAVILKAVSFSFDLDRSTLTWRVNGTIVKRGVGEKTAEIKTGNVGSETSVTLEAVTDRGTQSTSIVIRPGEVGLSWEALSYVPPFYKGKALATFESEVRVIATPNIIKGGVRLGSKKLVYTWKVNGKIDQSQSGYGKNIFKYKIPSTSIQGIVDLDVVTTDNSLRVRDSITIPVTEPLLLLYEDDPILGIKQNRALIGSFLLKAPEVRFFAAPYWSSPDSSGFAYKWKQNEELLEGDTPFRTFGVEANSRGESQISVIFSNSSKFLQFSSARIKLLYGSN